MNTKPVQQTNAESTLEVDVSHTAETGSIQCTSYDPDFSNTPPEDVLISSNTMSHRFPFAILDPDAIKAVRRLTRFGYETYLVGGCVRDILLGIQPKDFDLVTSALPSEVRRHFRNCRLIGRRFRLAHLYYKNHKIIEVATFRRTPTLNDDVSEQHASENLFGKPGDDAIRRDFTINALMYDVNKREVRDWVGGLEDIKNSMLRTIGNPERRIPEDPVRILRAIKFACRLNLTIEPGLAGAMTQNAHLIKKCAYSRLVEEIFKLLRSGCASDCILQTQKFGVLKHLLPNLEIDYSSSSSENSTFNLLQKCDAQISNGSTFSDSILLAALLYPACQSILESNGDVAKKLKARLKPLVAPLTFTRKHMGHVNQIYLAQRHLERGIKWRRTRKILDRDFAFEAIHFLKLRAVTEDQNALADDWLTALMSHRKKGRKKGPRLGHKSNTQRFIKKNTNNPTG